MVFKALCSIFTFFFVFLFSFFYTFVLSFSFSFFQYEQITFTNFRTLRPKHEFTLRGLKNRETSTYMSILVQVIVCELQFVESDRLFQPMRTRGRAVWVDVESPGHVGLRLPRHHPFRVVVLVPAVVQWHDVDE